MYLSTLYGLSSVQIYKDNWEVGCAAVIKGNYFVKDPKESEDLYVLHQNILFTMNALLNVVVYRIIKGKTLYIYTHLLDN